MISSGNGIDELDIVDFTTSLRFYDIMDRPLRPPSPFADEPPPIPSIIPVMIDHKSEEIIHRPSSLSRTARIKRRWQQTLHRLLKRKKNVFTPYHFGQGDLTVSRINVKHVHWIDDDDQMKLNLYQRLSECLKLLVTIVMNNDDPSDQDDYIYQCQWIINELSSFIDTNELEENFRWFTASIEKRNLHQLLEQQRKIEDLFSFIHCTTRPCVMKK